MLESLVSLSIGGGGMAAYVYLWNRLAPRGQQPSDTPEARNLRRRHRLWHIVFFLLLTPYVLLLFALIERAHKGLGI